MVCRVVAEMHHRDELPGDPAGELRLFRADDQGGVVLVVVSVHTVARHRGLPSEGHPPRAPEGLSAKTGPLRACD